MYSQIIVPFDGGAFSARSITVGRNLARLMNAPLKVVAFALTESHAGDLRVAVKREIETITEVPVSWQARKVHNVVTEISRELAEEPGGLICMGSVGRSRSAPILGSVAEGVLQETFGPVLLVGPHARTDRFVSAGVMVVCADGSSAGKAILPIAAQWAITLPFEPWVINVQDREGEPVSTELRKPVDRFLPTAGHRRQIDRRHDA